MIVMNRITISFVAFAVLYIHCFAAPKPIVSVGIISHQTSCITPNGEAEASVGGSTVGFEFRWYVATSSGDSLIDVGSRVDSLSAGPYKVIAEDLQTSETSDPIILEIHNATISPEVTLSFEDNIIRADSEEGNSYKWFLEDGSELPDTTSHITVSESGTYLVQVTSQLGCTAVRLISVVVENILGYNSTGREGLFLFPNPATKYFQISGGKWMNDVHVAVYDLRGKRILDLSRPESVDISHLLPGQYLVKLMNGRQVEFVQRLRIAE